METPGGLAVFVEILDCLVCVFLGFPEDGVGLLVGLGQNPLFGGIEALLFLLQLSLE